MTEAVVGLQHRDGGSMLLDSRGAHDLDPVGQAAARAGLDVRDLVADLFVDAGHAGILPGGIRVMVHLLDVPPARGLDKSSGGGRYSHRP